ncbi:hypothetical protein [Haloprofundus halobius]|uniref:hypothetical protein n=1 Tax=Haloprofundus halobius TaxID=2876194 RepID=UPI001CCB8061|nr:hypothetical protein [Haloprofundus halobius]
MTNPLFSTYTQGENRVTSTLLAVFEHINSALLEEILETVLDESDFQLITFENQVSGVDSVPDAVIRSSNAVWFETKTARDAVDRDQLERHLSALGDTERLVVLTPDAEAPTGELPRDGRIVWANFDDIVDAVEAVLDRDIGTTDEMMTVPTEREAFLLRELVRFIYDEGLTSGKEDRVLVVAARRAWPEYEKYGLYFCQVGRSFKPVSHLAFYTDGEIKTAVPRITGMVDSVELTEAGVKAHDDLTAQQRDEVSAAVAQMSRDGSWRHGEEQKVIFLSESLELPQTIQNDKTASDTNRTVAFVQGHRYVSLSGLQQQPTHTTELE